MSIVLGLLAAMAVIGVWLWRIQVAADAAREAVGAADDARSFWRRLLWGRKASRHPLDMIEDPREAAAAMMVAVAQYDGALTADEEALIKDEMCQTFEMTISEAEELFARGRWLVREQTTDPAQVLRRLLPPIERALNESERQELLTMLRVAAGLGTASTSVPHRAIDDLERRLLNVH